MASNIRVFISHRRNGGHAIPQAKQIKRTLEKDYGFSVFLDELNLESADDWVRAIFNEIHQADVLIVLLQTETYKSHWIQREVDMARCIFLPIIPLLIDDKMPKEELDEAIDRLFLSHIHYRYFQGEPDEYKTLAKRIQDLVGVTKKDQTEWTKVRRNRWRPVKADDQLSIAQFGLKNYPNPCTIHLTTGDISALTAKSGRAFDVIVNSENDHMQMARIFEGDRLSSVLRRKGALMEKDTLILLDDTVQRELDIQVVYNPAYYRPIEKHSVIPTYAGHPDSELVQQTGARYIFHTTTVGVDGMMAEADTPFPLVDNNQRMENAVHNVLRKIREVNEYSGQIFPEVLFESDTPTPSGTLCIFDKNTPQWKRVTEDKAHHEPITSVIFPIFGTGHAGLEVSAVATWMLRAFRTFPEKKRNRAADLHLSDIYFCVYSKDNIDLVRDAMQQTFSY